MPPAPAAGLTSVTFTITTFDPQIGRGLVRHQAAVRHRREHHVPRLDLDLRPARPADGHGPDVLYDRYTAELRSDRGDWVRKMGHIRNQRDEVLDRVQVRWGPYGNSAEPSTVFSCKISR